MNKKLRTSILLTLGVLIFVFVLAGCEKVPSVKANYVKLDGELWKNRVGERALVKDRNELLAFVEVMSIDLDELAKYDDNFFKSNALIVFNIIEENKDTKNEITSYAIENGTITINVETTKQGEGKDDKSTAYHFVLELSAQKASKITDIVILKNGAKLQGKVRNYARLYSLHEALKLSWMTLDDMRQLAHDRYQPGREPLDDAIALKIKKAKVAELEMYWGGIWWSDEKLEADDVGITFEGRYKDCYVVQLGQIGFGSTGMPPYYTYDFDDGITIFAGTEPFWVWHEA